MEDVNRRNCERGGRKKRSMESSELSAQFSDKLKNCSKK